MTVAAPDLKMSHNDSGLNLNLHSRERLDATKTIASNTSHQQLTKVEILVVSDSTTVEDPSGNDQEKARSMALGLRHRVKTSRNAMNHAPDIRITTQQEMDWETEYALYDGIREADQDDDENENYQ